MYNVASRFHTLAIADSPKTRCRIYFISDAVNCWDDADVQSNGTLLVGAAGDTDSNGRIGQGGVTVTEIFNKDKNLTIGGTVSYQIGMTLVNSDGALNNFAFGRCKVYLDVYDDANSAWLPCPLGVFRIELPVKRKVQLISCTGYDQMQVLNAIADTWWNGLNFTGGLTIESILNSMVTQLGLHLSANSSTNMVNKTLSFTTPPIDSVERTYRDILGWIAEATGTVAHFNRDGELDMRPYLTPQIGGNNIVIDTDTTGNQCLSIDVAEYSVSQIDALTIKLTTSDQGVTVGSGTNVYTIMDNPFLYGPDVATIQGKLTPIYNRLSAYATYSPISTRLIYDWSIESGDIIYIINNSTTYNMPIFQQKMTWRGGYVTAELISSGDTVRPQVSSGERETYRYNVEMATKVGDNEIISKINQTAEQITIQASKVDLAGYVTFTNLATSGQTTINGGNITTGTIDAGVVNVTNLNASNITSGTLSANYISGGTLKVGGISDTNGIIRVYDSTGSLSGTISNIGVTIAGKDPSQSHNMLNNFYGFLSGIRDTTTGKQLSVYDCVLRNSTDEFGRLTLYGYDEGTQVSSVQLQADPYSANHGAYLQLNGPDGIVRLNSDGTYAGDLTMTIGNLTVGSIGGGDVEINGVLDVTPRRCYATLSSRGWYRVLKVNAKNSAIAKGYTGQMLDINVSRRSDTTYGELHKISFMNYLDSGTFANESSISGSLNIDKIRYTYDATQGIGYIDIHYNTSNSNGVTIDFDVHTWQLSKGLYVSTNPTRVADSPSGETVLTEYTFAANTEYTRYIWTPTFSGTANPSVNNASCFYSVKNGVLYAGGRFNLASFTSGGTTVSFTLPVSLGSADRSAETIGTMFTTTKTLQLRWDGSTVYITDAGGNYSGNLLNTGYWSFQIVAPIYN